MDVCILWVLCDARYRPLRRANHSSRAVLPSMVCLWSWTPLGAVAPWDVGGNWRISFLRNEYSRALTSFFLMRCGLMVTQHLLLSSSEVEKRLPLKRDSRICTQIFRSYIIKFYDVAPQNILWFLPSQSEISALTFKHPIRDDTKISFPLSWM